MDINNTTQAELLRYFNDTHREQFNPEYFVRSDQDIMNCMKKIIMSCERDKYFTIKVLDMREIYSYEEIMDCLRVHKDMHMKKNRDINQYNYININDSKIMLLQIKYFIRHNGTEIVKVNGESQIVHSPKDILDVFIALPRYTKKYYFKLNGNYYSDIFQIVDGSTYNNSNSGNKKAPCNTFKTFFSPIRMFRMYKDLTDFHSKQVIRCYVYTAIITMVYNTNVNVMYYLFGNFGYYGALEFLGIDCVVVREEPMPPDEWYSFEKGNLFVCCPKFCYQDYMVQSLVVTFVSAINSNTTINDIYDIHYWIKLIGAQFKNSSIDKGLFILDSIDGIYDIITHDDLHLPEEEKMDIYCIFRWMMREFKNIKNKNNVNVTTKRYRLGEPIAATYANKLSIGLSRISGLGKKVTLDQVKKVLNIDPMYVIKTIGTMSNLISYRDMVNDNDATTALKYTYKGISGLGDKGTSVQKTYRFVDPSHAGILDLDSSTTSDPGMSGTICPLSKTYEGNSFSEYEEPNTWKQEFGKNVHEVYRKAHRQEGTMRPVLADRPIERDPQECRKRVIEESLDIDRVIVPFRTVSGESPLTQNLEEFEKKKSQVESLFTIREETE